MDSFDEILREAVSYYERYGFDDADQLAVWMAKLRAAMERELTPEWQMEKRLRDALGAILRREVDRGAILKRHAGVNRYVLDQVRPHLRAELSRRVVANAQLIKLNRAEEIDKTLRRFAGWATSVPKGGSEQVDVRATRKEIRKGFASLPFRERRVLIDQGHKLQAAVSDTVAKGGGAIAAEWESHYHQVNYDYREDHKQRAIDSKRRPFLIRDSWAMQRGYLATRGATFTDDMTQPGEEVFCRCKYKYLYHLRALPADMLTDKGREALAEARKRIAA